MSVSGLTVGIVGLANVGKSTLFNALLKKQVAVSANYPFTTIEPNIGIVEVPDNRLEKLAEVIARGGVDPSTSLRTNRPPVIPATVRFVDIAGLVKGAHKGEGLGNQFLAHIREVDVIVFVLRGFGNEDIIRSGSTDPKDDLEVLKDELLLKDLETLENQKSKIKDQNYNPKFKSAVEKLIDAVQKGKWAQEVDLDSQELLEAQNLNLLTMKKAIVVINSDEEDLGKDAPIEGALRICAKLEEELASLSDEEQKEYLGQLGVRQSGLEKLIKKAYETLNLATFLTAGPKEVRAWTIKKGTLAPQAAGIIHSDFEKGFIAADVIAFDKFVEAGGWQKAREKGLVKTIGKSEEIKDGLVVEFKFSV